MPVSKMKNRRCLRRKNRRCLRRKNRRCLRRKNRRCLRRKNTRVPEKEEEHKVPEKEEEHKVPEKEEEHKVPGAKNLLHVLEEHGLIEAVQRQHFNLNEDEGGERRKRCLRMMSHVIVSHVKSWMKRLHLS